MDITLEEFEALCSLARSGVSSADAERKQILETFISMIESKNNITRYSVWVQWQEAGKPLPIGTSFPEKWPREWRTFLVRYDRPWARSDVESYVKKQVNAPINIMLTKDSAALVGWLPIERFFR